MLPPEPLNTRCLHSCFSPPHRELTQLEYQLVDHRTRRDDEHGETTEMYRQPDRSPDWRSESNALRLIRIWNESPTQYRFFDRRAARRQCMANIHAIRHVPCAKSAISIDSSATWLPFALRTKIIAAGTSTLANSCVSCPPPLGSSM